MSWFLPQNVLVLTPVWFFDHRNDSSKDSILVKVYIMRQSKGKTMSRKEMNTCEACWIRFSYTNSLIRAFDFYSSQSLCNSAHAAKVYKYIRLPKKRHSHKAQLFVARRIDNDKNSTFAIFAITDLPTKLNCNWWTILECSVLKQLRCWVRCWN